METRSKAASRNRDNSESTSKNQSNTSSKTIREMSKEDKRQKKKNKKSSLIISKTPIKYLRIVLHRFDEQPVSKNEVIKSVKKMISNQKKMK